MNRVYNFSAGPAMLPTPVMEHVQAELLDWRGSGMSVMEISHRSPEFSDIAEESKQNLRELLNIPDNYHILFLHGGAQTQFAMVPMNLLGAHAQTAYLQTGLWGKLAANEAKRYAPRHFVVNTEETGFSSIPEPSTWNLSGDNAYVYYVDNETVNGVEFSTIPGVGDVPLVCDMSSNLLTRSFDVSRFGLIFACAQKNLGPAGVTVVIIRDDLLQREPLPMTPHMCRYHLHVEKNSMLNTAPTFPWYVVGEVFKWVKRQGGVAAMEEFAKQRSQMLYDVIDNSTLYTNNVDPAARSRVNVVFDLPDDTLLKEFLKQATAADLPYLKGHRTVGGVRASMYVAMPVEGAKALVDFMKHFEQQYK